jgi:hypothetical protein
MNLKGIIDIDFINYKKTSMVLEFPKCSFKCDKECGKQVCQNSELASAPDIEISNEEIIQFYLENPLTEAIVMQGLEPFDSLGSLYNFIYDFREVCNDDIVIYTGYKEEEIYPYLNFFKKFSNIYIKFGRYRYDRPSRYDEVLGVTLASTNQYCKKIC